MTIERKTSLAVAIKSADKGEARIRFASPDGATVDKDRDITGPEAFTEGAQAVVSPFGHRSIWDGATPAGRAVIHQDGTADLHYFLDTSTGLESFRTVKGLGLIVQYSYGFHVLQEGDLTDAMRAAGARRYLKRLAVLELSPVVEGAGISTGTLHLKACGCGAGSTCGCASGLPSGAEIAALAADYARILAATAETPEQLAARIAAGIEAVQAKYGAWEPAEVRADPELRHAAVAHAAWAAARLGILPPAVRFFARASAKGKRNHGLYFDGTHEIWLRDDLREWELVKTCIHEVLHANRGARGMRQAEQLVELETEQLLTVFAREVFYGRQ